MSPVRTVLRRMALAAVLAAAASATGSAQDPGQGAVTLDSRVFGNTRTLRVLLPPGYSAPQNRERRYPVFYFTDGVAAWDAWGVPAVVKELWQMQAIPEFIFVGIDNGGSTRESKTPILDRASEYLPYPDQTWIESSPEARGDRFPRFLFEDVVPRIAGVYRTLSSGACTGLAGASYGAAVTLHTAIRHPDRLGFVLLESPSLHIGDGRLLVDAADATQWPGRLYLGVGTAEGDTGEAQERMLQDAIALQATLARARHGPVVRFIQKPGAIHWYSAWRERLPEALTFLLSNAAATRCAAGPTTSRGDSPH